MSLSTGISVARRVACGHRMSAAFIAFAATAALFAAPGAALASSSVSWSSATGVDVNGGGVMSVSCPAANQCTGIDRAGQEITFDPTKTSNEIIKTASIAGTEALNVVSCPSTAQCTAVDGDGHEFTFNPVSGSVITQSLVDPGNALYFVACGTSTTQCVATERNGNAVVSRILRMARSSVNTLPASTPA